MEESKEEETTHYGLLASSDWLIYRPQQVAQAPTVGLQQEHGLAPAAASPSASAAMAVEQVCVRACVCVVGVGGDRGVGLLSARDTIAAEQAPGR